MAHIPQIDMLPDAVRAVIADVAECDCLGPGTARPFFLTGMSLGGLTVLLASMRHESDVTDFHDRLLGTYALCPVIGSMCRNMIRLRLTSSGRLSS
jgi:alpha-beta hydrolase superfamily lysophospholipase